MASKEPLDPAHKDPPPHGPQQQGTRKPIKYYDIMVIGKTGVGKSTTADKLLIANPLGRPYEGQQHQDPILDTTTGQMRHEDICMWQLSDEEGEIERVTKRLKNLVFCRSLSAPHEEVNLQHVEGGSIAGSTDHCELISNDSTNVRILDVPGFYGSKACTEEPHDVLKRASAVADNDLSIMRKILHIKMAKNFRFNRIVYFLPETGILERDSQVLHTEIGIMENYFGRSIFESMVVVATYPASVYKFIPRGSNLFPPEDLEKARKHFQMALEKVLGGGRDVSTTTADGGDVATPAPPPLRPPIISVSLFDTCETILSKIQNSPVARPDGVELQFNPHVCARCNVRIAMLKEDRAGTTVAVGRTEGRLAACAYDNNWAEAVPYEDSTCHPLLIPKYTTLQKIVGEIAHIITLKKFMGRWPSLNNLDEVCANCRESPKSRGCLKVHTYFTKGSGRIKVDHTSKVAEEYVIEMPEEDEGDDPSLTGAVVSGRFYREDSGHCQGYASVSVGVRGLAQRGVGDGGEEEEEEGREEEGREEEGGEGC